MNVREAHALFDYEVREAAKELDADQRRALVRMLKGLRATAIAKGVESQRKNKWMMLAYWRVVAVYAGHFARITQRAVTDDGVSQTADVQEATQVSEHPSPNGCHRKNDHHKTSPPPPSVPGAETRCLARRPTCRAATVSHLEVGGHDEQIVSGYDRQAADASSSDESGNETHRGGADVPEVSAAERDQAHSGRPVYVGEGLPLVRGTVAIEGAEPSAPPSRPSSTEDEPLESQLTREEAAALVEGLADIKAGRISPLLPAEGVSLPASAERVIALMRKAATEERRLEHLAAENTAKAAHRMYARGLEHFIRLLSAALSFPEAATDICRVCGKRAYFWSFGSPGDATREKRAYCRPQCMDIETERERQARAVQHLQAAGFDVPPPSGVVPAPQEKTEEKTDDAGLLGTAVPGDSNDPPSTPKKRARCPAVSSTAQGCNRRFMHSGPHRDWHGHEWESVTF